VSDVLERTARPRPDTADEAALWDVVATVVDPEVPVLTIADLGVLRAVRREGSSVVVTITPTYSGCPAVDAISADVVQALRDAGHPDARVDVALAPAWTSDWMSEEGRRKLAEYGIAPPRRRVVDGVITLGLGVACPRCGSHHVRAVSHYGSTACKALYVCQRCQEPFDHFKDL